MSLRGTRDVKDNYQLFRLTGLMDAFSEGTFRKVVGGYIEEEKSPKHIIFDLSQIDLPNGIESGLQQALRILKNIPDIATIIFDETDVVRHPIVAKIVAAYDNESKKNNVR